MKRGRPKKGVAREATAKDCYYCEGTKMHWGKNCPACNGTGIKPDNLYTIFSRNKAKEHETNEFRIIKAKIERA